MAVVAPILITLIFGIVEFGWTMMIRQSLVNAARDGCRTAVIRYTSTSMLEQAVRNRINSILAPIGLSVDEEVTLEMDHAANPPMAPNDMETVTLSVPLGTVSLLGDFFGLGDVNMQATCTMRKEQ